MEEASNESGKERKPRARKRSKDAPAHVVSVPLRLTPAQRSMEDARFESSRRVYNACLGEALRRCQKVRSDPAFELAKGMPTGRKGPKESGVRNHAFRTVEDVHGFTETAMMTFASGLRHEWVRVQVPSQETQVLGRRAYRATLCEVNDYAKLKDIPACHRGIHV